MEVDLCTLIDMNFWYFNALVTFFILTGVLLLYPYPLAKYKPARSGILPGTLDLQTAWNQILLGKVQFELDHCK